MTTDDCDCNIVKSIKSEIFVLVEHPKVSRFGNTVSELTLTDAALFGTTRINNYHVEESSSGTAQ